MTPTANAPSLTHAARHAAGGADPVTPAAIGAVPLAALTGLTAISTAGRSALNLTDYQKLMPWFAALANRRNQRVSVALLGDSIIEGHPCTDYSRTVSSSLAAALCTRFPVAGVVGGRGYVGMPSATARADTGLFPIAFTGGAFDISVFGGGGCKKNLWYTNTSGDKAVFTVAGPLTSFDILHVKSTAGGASNGYYKIDGGTAVVFASNAGANTPTVLHVASAVTATIEIGWNASGYLALDGIVEYKGDEAVGVQVHNCGNSGTGAAFWNTAPALWPASIKLLAPNLMVINLGTNDSTVAIGNRTSVQFKSDMVTLIASLRTAAVTCPIALSMIWDSTLVRVEPWANYVAAAGEIAIADATVIVVDSSARMPVGASAPALALGLYSDGVHSAANGNAYSYLADTLASVLTPR